MLRYVAVAVLLNGCAFFQGKRHAVALLETQPQGAAVYKIYTRHMASEKVVDEHVQLLGYTPLLIKVPKDANIMVVFVKDGYKKEEFIIRTGYRKIYDKEGKYYMGCLDEGHYGWVMGGVVNNLSDLLAPDIRKLYCTSDRYEYEIKLKSLSEQESK